MTDYGLPLEWKLITWAVIAGLIAAVLTVVVLVRKAPPITTQTDRTTGVKDHGILTWMALFFGIGDGPPLLIWVSHKILPALVWVSSHWWLWLIVGVLVLSGIIGWWQLRPHEEEPLDELEPVLEHNPAPSLPLAGWTLNPDTPHWAERPTTDTQ